VRPALSVLAVDSGTRPNIVFIMADDHATRAISAYNPETPVATPNLDRLASQGMRFNNMSCVNSVCGPSRANLLSGRHTAQNGFFSNFDEFDGDQPTFPKLLQAAGYQTAIIGKWHLNSRPTGFDSYSILAGHGRFFDSPFLGPKDPWREIEVSEGYLTDVLTDKSIDWIKKRDQSKPFCLMIHHKAPHEPHEYPEKYSALLKDEELPFPSTFDTPRSQRGEALENSSGRWCKLEYTHPAWLNKPAPAGIEQGTEAYKRWAYQTFFKGYYRLVASLDDNVGRLLDYLDRTGLSQNTLVVYTSDNGFFLGEFGMFNKMWMYENSMNIPLIVRWPGKIKPGTVNDALVTMLDIAPTFVDLAKGNIDPRFQGRSLLPLLSGKAPDDWRTAVFYHYHGGFDIPAQMGVRTDRYKLIHFLEMPPPQGTVEPIPYSGKGSNMVKGESWEFYDLKTDPLEQRNLYGSPEYAEPVQETRLILKELLDVYEQR
jgi:arylsulfatase A-like enzyme